MTRRILRNIGSLAVVVAGSFSGAAGQERNDMLVMDFRSNPAPEWYTVNDGVMGGRSQSSFAPTPDGAGRFEGYVSLENNGGFASVRTVMERPDFGGFEGLELRIRGDGRTYDLRLRTDGRFDGMAYRAAFETEPGEWQIIRVPFSSFQPTFRGWTPRNAPPLDIRAIRQMGFLVGGKLEGPFALEVEWIRAYATEPATGSTDGE